MSEKKPQAGEWWRDYTGRIVNVMFVDGIANNVWPLWCHAQSVTTKGIYGEWLSTGSLIEHLPDCTGFDWVLKPATRAMKLCSVVYWDRPDYPMSTVLTEHEIDRHRKAWRVVHIVSETTVEVPV